MNRTTSLHAFAWHARHHRTERELVLRRHARALEAARHPASNAPPHPATEFHHPPPTPRVTASPTGSAPVPRHDDAAPDLTR